MVETKITDFIECLINNDMLRKSTLKFNNMHNYY